MPEALPPLGGSPASQGRDDDSHAHHEAVSESASESETPHLPPGHVACVLQESLLEGMRVATTRKPERWLAFNPKLNNGVGYLLGAGAYRMLKFPPHPSTLIGGERLVLDTEDTLAARQPNYFGFDESIPVNEASTTIILKPGVVPGMRGGGDDRSSDVWAVVLDMRLGVGADSAPVDGQADDVILHSRSSGGATLRVAANHPNIVRIVLSSGADLHTSLLRSEDEVRAGAGRCCICVPCYQSKLAASTMPALLAAATEHDLKAFREWRARDELQRQRCAERVGATEKELGCMGAHGWREWAKGYGHAVQRAIAGSGRIWDELTGGYYAPAGEGGVHFLRAASHSTLSTRSLALSLTHRPLNPTHVHVMIGFNPHPTSPRLVLRSRCGSSAWPHVSIPEQWDGQKGATCARGDVRRRRAGGSGSDGRAASCCGRSSTACWARSHTCPDGRPTESLPVPAPAPAVSDRCEGAHTRAHPSGPALEGLAA